MLYNHLLETLNVSLFLSIPVITMALLVTFSRAPEEAKIPIDKEEPKFSDTPRG